jgi:serine/threonine protein kinase
MTVTAGTRLGAYEIVALIGAGGMGEMYHARDTKLNRDVALKILPELFAADPERLARFKREAQVLASLNHPNIGAIYGFEESSEVVGAGFSRPVQALVLELVDGPTLADRIAHGPMPLDEALAIARQIAEALEAAHEQGIVHRDLKPANIKLRPDGMVKVLDFGLAKAFEAEPVAAAALSMSPTITSPAATRIGTILGTAAYMSPEQARGKAVDRRSDIWAFGCVLYEMLTGHRPFDGSEVTDVLARVLEREPDYAALPTHTPEAIRRLIRRCLEKDPRERLPHIGLARLDIKDARSEATSPATRLSQSPGRAAAIRYGTLASLAVILDAVVSGVWVGTETAAPLWFSILPPQPNAARVDAQIPGTAFTATEGVAAAALSADGTQIVFSAPDGFGSYSLWVRRFDSPEARVIPQTQGALLPFWSPDG